MGPTLLAGYEFTLHVYYAQVALRDWLVEVPHEQTSALLRSGHGEVAVADGGEILMFAPEQDTAVIRVDVWDGDPGIDRLGYSYRHSPPLTLLCPSGRLYVESATGTPQNLPDALAVGTYTARVSRRRAPTEEPDTQAEQYVAAVWRTGELPREWLDDDDD